MEDEIVEKEVEVEGRAIEASGSRGDEGILEGVRIGETFDEERYSSESDDGVSNTSKLTYLYHKTNV